MSAELKCATLRNPPLAPHAFVATSFETAEDKARMGDMLLSFIARGMPRSAWNKRLYRRLSNMFGFIAHYDINGFWEEQLSTTQARIAFLEQIEAYPCWGQPTHTWSDVERKIRNRLRAARLADAYRSELRREKERTERAMLAALSAKYKHLAPAGAPMMPSAEPVQLGLF